MELYYTNNTFKTFVGAKALKPTHKKKDVGPQFGLGIFFKEDRTNSSTVLSQHFYALLVSAYYQFLL